jgi:hypothetical protein
MPRQGSRTVMSLEMEVDVDGNTRNAPPWLTCIQTDG